MIFGILLFEEVEELDFVGPWEVFGSLRLAGKDVEVVAIAQTREPVRCANRFHGLRRVSPGHVRRPAGRGSVAQVGPEPALHFRDGESTPRGVVFELIAPDAPDGEVARLGMGEVEAAHAGGRRHGGTLRE